MLTKIKKAQPDQQTNLKNKNIYTQYKEVRLYFLIRKEKLQNRMNHDSKSAFLRS